MSDNTTSAADTNQPKAATLAELKEACPGASSDFLLEQLEKNATVTGAIKAHAKCLADEKAALAKENADLKAKAQAAPAKPQRGNPPIGGDAKEEDEASESTDAIEKFNSLVEAKVAGGMARDRAVQAVVRANPELHAQMIAAANAR